MEIWHILLLAGSE